MLSNPAGAPEYRRRQFEVLASRLTEPRRFVQVVAGPRQVGKSTLVRQVLAELGVQAHSASADDPGIRDATWLEAQWNTARLLPGPGPWVLALDEIQKVPRWSEAVKRLWDEDTAAGWDLRVILLGSAPIEIQQGITESLAGRFELVTLAHWSYAEMSEAFGWDLETFLRFGGYPGAAPLVGEAERWRAYMLDALIETTLSRDLLLLTRIDKPALLRQLFRVGMDASGQVISYQKLLGQLQDAGNTVTLAHYLRLLRGVGLLAGLEKFEPTRLRQRGSSPKLLALDPGLLTAMSPGSPGASMSEADHDRKVQTAVGAHLLNTADRSVEITWWRQGDREVDFVVSRGSAVAAIEVAHGRRRPDLRGIAAFRKKYPEARPVIVGEQGIPLERALRFDAARYLEF